MKKAILFLIFYVSLLCLKAQDCSSCNATNWFTVVPPGVSTTYSIPAELGANYIWLATGGVSILSGQGTNTVTVLVNSDGNLSITRFGNGKACANSAAIRANQPLSLSRTCDVFSSNIVPVIGAVSYNWYINGTFLMNSTTTSLSSADLLNRVKAGVIVLHTGAQNVCVEALNSAGVVISLRFCVELKSCPLNVKIDISKSCSSPIVSVEAVPSAIKYNWYINDTFVKSTNDPNLVSLSSSGDLSGSIKDGLSIVLFWNKVRLQFAGQELKTLCVEAINSSNLLANNTIRTCIAFPSCGSVGGDGGSGGGGSGGTGGGGDPIMQEAMQLSIYPNPSSNELIVSFGDEITEIKPYRLTIYNSKGVEVKSIEITERNQKIYTGDLPKDDYVMKVANGKKIETRRIVIQ